MLEFVAVRCDEIVGRVHRKGNQIHNYGAYAYAYVTGGNGIVPDARFRDHGDAKACQDEFGLDSGVQNGIKGFMEKDGIRIQLEGFVMRNPPWQKVGIDRDAEKRGEMDLRSCFGQGVPPSSVTILKRNENHSQ